MHNPLIMGKLKNCKALQNFNLRGHKHGNKMWEYNLHAPLQDTEVHTRIHMGAMNSVTRSAVDLAKITTSTLLGIQPGPHVLPLRVKND